ncbi:hypothetical protein HK102_013127, partial [Quaeritorhiza haematococci]
MNENENEDMNSEDDQQHQHQERGVPSSAVFNVSSSTSTTTSTNGATRRSKSQKLQFRGHVRRGSVGCTRAATTPNPVNTTGTSTTNRRKRVQSCPSTATAPAHAPNPARNPLEPIDLTDGLLATQLTDNPPPPLNRTHTRTHTSSSTSTTSSLSFRVQKATLEAQNALFTVTDHHVE